MATQREHRRGVDVASGLLQVSSAAYWHKHGFFKNDDEARGAFRLAHHQGLDGMGESIQEWMGLTPEEFDAWMRTDEIPSRSEHR
jgi:hypothetical protein